MDGSNPHKIVERFITGELSSKNALRLLELQSSYALSGSWQEEACEYCSNMIKKWTVADSEDYNTAVDEEAAYQWQAQKDWEKEQAQNEMRARSELFQETVYDNEKDYEEMIAQIAIDEEKDCGLTGPAVETGETTPGPAKEIPETIPPVIQAIIGTGFLEKDCDTDGKHKPIGKKDKDIIQWVFNYSGYADDLTAEIYKKYVYTTNKATTIDKYISECRNLAK